MNSEERKAYRRKWMADKRAREQAGEQPSVNTKPVNKHGKLVNKHLVSIWHPEISQDRFKGKGRGVPVDGYVLVSIKSEPNGNTEHGIVDVDTWHARLDKGCAHGLAGWSCKPCLPV